jgi:general secretion pathway protein D
MDAEELAEGEPANEAIQLTFPDDVELKTVIDYVAPRLGINILYDETVAKQRVTIRSPAPIEPDKLLPLLRSALKFRGLALVDAEQAGWLTVVPADRLAQESHWSDPEAGSPKEQKQAHAGDGALPRDANRVITHVVRLEHIGVASFEELARGMLSKPGGNLVVLPDQKTLIITDYARIVGHVLRLQALIDTVDAKQTWQILPVEHASASRVGMLIEGILRQTGAGTTGETGGQAGRAGKSSAATILALPNRNALLVTGNAEQIDRARSLLEVLDVADKLSTRMHRLRFTSASRAATILEQMTGPGRGGGDDGRWIINPDAEANALIITAPAAGHEQIERWLDEMIDLAPEATPTGVATRVFTIKFARAQELSTTLGAIFSPGLAAPDLGLDLDGPGQDSPKPVPDQITDQGVTRAGNPPQEGGEKQPPPDIAPPKAPTPLSIFGPDPDQPVVRMTVDVPTNSIICTAPTPILAQIERLIERLDHHRPQVLIEAVIVSLSRSNAVDLGVEVNYIRSDNGQLSDALLTSFGLFDVDPVSGAVTATVGPGLNAVLLRSDEVSVIVRALQTKLNARVVAKPRLLVADNETGTINSISEQPFTSVNAGQTVSTTSFGGYAEAGTQVDLTPHISESDVVHLDYTIVSSAFTGSPTDPSLPPPRATDSVSSRVTVPSGYTLLVGGLTRKDRRETKRQVPLVGDVPLLGALFRSSNDTETETTLYVFLQPVIHREDRFAYLRYSSTQALQNAELPEDVPELQMEMIR